MSGKKKADPIRPKLYLYDLPLADVLTLAIEHPDGSVDYYCDSTQEWTSSVVLHAPLPRFWCHRSGATLEFIGYL